MSGVVILGVGLGLVVFAVLGFVVGEIILWRRRKKLAARYAPAGLKGRG
jgi:hypothetical protein